MISELQENIIVITGVILELVRVIVYSTVISDVQNWDLLTCIIRRIVAGEMVLINQ